MKTSMLRLCLLILLVGSPTVINGAAIPIWELLTHEEKVNFKNWIQILKKKNKQSNLIHDSIRVWQMGRLFYVFVHLVQQYCKTSDIPGKSTLAYYFVDLVWEMKQFSLPHKVLRVLSKWEGKRCLSRPGVEHQMLFLLQKG